MTPTEQLPHPSPEAQARDPIEMPKRGSPLIRLYFRSQRLMQQLTLLQSSMFTGLWLGFLTRKQLHDIGEGYFRQERFYSTDEWNTRGLFDWEKQSVEAHFGDCKKLLVAGAGGGREVIALRRLGFDVDGFDSHPDLIRAANELLEREGMAPDIRQAPWDHCVHTDRKYDGVIIGWSAYMHIRGRDRRVGFLRELRDKVGAGAPMLLSFYVTSPNSRYFRWVARVGGPLARVLRRDPVLVGDCLLPFYAHFFTQERLEAELAAGGFQLVSFELIQYAHAIARAT
jgi:hypothetical protein